MISLTCAVLLLVEDGFHLSQSIAYPVGIAFAAVCAAVYGIWIQYV